MTSSKPQVCVLSQMEVCSKHGGAWYAKAEQLREQGNACVKAGNYSEAILHYSHALHQDPKNHFLYSNRSLAFLKMQQYYLAIQDANKAISLQPKWPKGYFRKGEVEQQAGHFSTALLSYEVFVCALWTIPWESTSNNWIIVQMFIENAREPWIFGGGGAFLGLLIVLADQLLAKHPSIGNLVLQIMLVLVFTGLGIVAFKITRYLKESEIKSLLQPPIDLLAEMEGKKKENSNEVDDLPKQTDTKPHRKGGTSAGRQRFKKGKS